MRKRGLSLGLGITLLVVIPAGEAVAKEVCCYRVHANTSNQLHVEDHGGTGAGAQNGTYDLSSTWAVRELVIYNSKRYGDSYFNPVQTRRQKEVPGMAKFKGSESSNQWYMDGSTSPPTRRDYPPCRYAKDIPWHRADTFLGVILERGGGAEAGHNYLRTLSNVGAAEYEGACDNTAPFYGHLSGWALGSPGHESYWDSLGTSINVSLHESPPHTSPPLNLAKLKKMKDQVVTFEQPTFTATSQIANPHTYTVTHRTVVRFTWFPYDRLQKELNELDALK